MLPMGAVTQNEQLGKNRKSSKGRFALDNCVIGNQGKQCMVTPRGRIPKVTCYSDNEIAGLPGEGREDKWLKTPAKSSGQTSYVPLILSQQTNKSLEQTKQLLSCFSCLCCVVFATLPCHACQLQDVVRQEKKVKQ